MEMHPIQAMINGMNEERRRERASSQMTLGKLIARLEAMPHEAQVTGINSPHSYRGYYSDLAFEGGAKGTVSDALKICRAAMGEVFEGYKGGEFQMGRDTPVWVASYGSTGQKIMGVNNDGSLLLANDE